MAFVSQIPIYSAYFQTQTIQAVLSYSFSLKKANKINPNNPRINVLGVLDSSSSRSRGQAWIELNIQHQSHFLCIFQSELRTQWGVLQRQNHTDAIQMSTMTYCNVTFWCEMEPFFAMKNNNATRCQIQSKEVLGPVCIYWKGNIKSIPALSYCFCREADVLLIFSPTSSWGVKCNKFPQKQRAGGYYGDREWAVYMLIQSLLTI